MKRRTTTDHGPWPARSAVLATCGALVGLWRASRADTPAIPLRRQGGGGTVARLHALRIGGVEQWVIERSEDTDNPLVLFLHGGPGTSQLTLNRRKTRALERDFVVVNWDQRGAGKSFRAIRDASAMTIDRLVEDTHELTLDLLRRYGRERLVLAGHSFGSVIGTLAVARRPDLYACYVGIGQVGSMTDGERASYRWTLEEARRRDDGKAIAALEAIGPPPYPGDWRRKTIAQRTYVARYGGEIHAGSRGAVGLVLGGVLASREYTLLDRVNVFRGVLGSMRLLWPELLQVDLIAAVPRLDVPVVFALGRHDHECPSEIAARYFETLEAPSKQLVWFERSAHAPNWEEPEAFAALMRERIRPLAVEGPHDSTPRATA